MPLAIRTEDLRKVYTSPPPPATMAGAFSLSRKPGAKKRGKEKVEIVALAGLTLEVRPGEIFGLLGPNGAGKSTTIGILTTRIRPSGGRAFIGDRDVWEATAAVKPVLGVVPQRPNLDFSLTVREILIFHGAYFGLSKAERTDRAQRLLDRFHLADRADELPRGLSGGMMQRVSIARAMMHDPEVLFLDEPSAGLDPQTRLLLWDIVREYNARGKTIIVTTHNMEEADALCGRVGIVDHGRLIALGTPGELKSSIPGGYVIHMKFHPRTEELLEKLRRLAGVTEARSVGENGADLYAGRAGPLVAEAVNAALTAGAEISDVNISEPSLENLFLHHTGRSLRD
jgi:ABC-2 type transport system ATP-binding protein